MAAAVEGLLVVGDGLPESVADQARVPLQVADLVFLPISNQLKAALGASASLSLAPEFYDLLPEVRDLALHASATGRVGYVNLEFHGGTGFHEAVGWESGEVAWGPDFTANEPESERFRQVRSSASDWAINGLLRWMGVVAAEGCDEFATAGLDRWRWTQEWVLAGLP